MMKLIAPQVGRNKYMRKKMKCLPSLCNNIERNIEIETLKNIDKHLPRKSTKLTLGSVIYRVIQIRTPSRKI